MQPDKPEIEALAKLLKDDYSVLPLDSELKPYVISPEELELEMDRKKFLGVGGSGVVYPGYYKKHDKKYEIAAKQFQLTDAFDVPQRIKEIEQEAKIMIAVRSKHTVNLIGIYIIHTGIYYLIMDCYKGTLSPPLKDKFVTMSLALRWAEQIIRGIQYIHGKGYLHRDIKIDNILLDKEDNAIIADFGFSQPKGTYLERPAGTIVYMAPELCSVSAHYATESSDIYSYGVLLWAIVSQQTDIPLSTIVNYKKKNFDPSGMLLCFKTIIDGCLNYNPAERLTTDDIVKQLEKIRLQYESKPKSLPKDIAVPTSAPAIATDDKTIVIKSLSSSTDSPSEKQTLEALKKLSLVASQSNPTDSLMLSQPQPSSLGSLPHQIPCLPL